MFSRISSVLQNAGMFNAIPAHKIDQLHLEEPRSLLGRVQKFAMLRFWYTSFFIASAFDLFSTFAISARHAIGAAAQDEGQQDRHLASFKFYARLFSKNALVFMTMPIVAPAVYLGIASPGAVTVRFLKEKPNKGVYAGGNLYHAQEATIVEPDDIDELKKIILKARQEKVKIIPVGAGRSQGKQFLPNGKGIVIDLSRFNTIEINSKKKTAKVGAGVRWVDLQMRADQHKLAIQVMQASNVFSVGGSIGTNVHGWKHTMGTLSNTILSMDIINAQGELQTLTPQDDLFHAVTGGHGLVGIVVNVKLQLTDNELLFERAKEVPISEYSNYFYEQVLPSDEIRMHLYRLSLDPKNLLARGMAVSYVKKEGSVPCKTPNLSAERDHGNRNERILLDAAREFDSLRRKWWDGEVNRLLDNTSPAETTNAIMRPAINAMFTSGDHKAEWLQEFFLPGDQLEAYLAFLGPLLMENKVVLFNASVRFVKANVHPDREKTSPLAYAPGVDRFAIVLCWHQSLEYHEVIRAQKWIRLAQHTAIEMGGTYYLPYQHFSSLSDFQQGYPNAHKLLAIKKDVDPDNLFDSGFFEKYMTNHPVENYIQAIMKDNASKDAFAGFLDKVLQRVDSKKFYALMDDILKYTDTRQEIYVELRKRLPEIMPGSINSMSRILSSLSTIKADLSQQANFLLADVQEINGLVEIGYPGRFIPDFRKNFKVTGKTVVVLEQLSMTDYIQTGYPAPYDEFHKFDYNNPNLAGLVDDSADVITCYVGLHHFPIDKLDAFLKDVRRVLHPAGRFLLMDHDVVDVKSLHHAKAAHTFFNAVYDVSVEEEMKETRHFHSINYWRKCLAKHGLEYHVVGADVPMIRDKDPSRNRMVCFKKGAMNSPVPVVVESSRALRV